MFKVWKCVSLGFKIKVASHLPLVNRLENNITQKPASNNIEGIN
mgnify:CR=1